MHRARSSPSAATCIRCALHRSLNLLCTRSAPTHAVGHVRWCSSSSFVRSRTPRARLTFDISAQQRRELASRASCCACVHARHILFSCTFVTPALGSHAVVTVYNSLLADGFSSRGRRREPLRHLTIRPRERSCVDLVSYQLVAT
jgi:hypothetical protein